MKSYISSKVKKEKSRIGYGIFALERILKDELIIDFTNAPGQLIHTADTHKFYEKGDDYMIQVDDDLFFAATNSEELEDSDFLNHSCNPNCGIKDRLKIVAMRDIEIGEEITFDYAMSESDPDFKMGCACQSKNCRNIVTGDDWKIKELQKKYNGFFSEYLQKKIDMQK